LSFFAVLKAIHLFFAAAFGGFIANDFFVFRKNPDIKKDFYEKSKKFLVFCAAFAVVSGLFLLFYIQLTGLLALKIFLASLLMLLFFSSPFIIKRFEMNSRQKKLTHLAFVLLFCAILLLGASVG